MRRGSACKCAFAVAAGGGCVHQESPKRLLGAYTLHQQGRLRHTATRPLSLVRARGVPTEHGLFVHLKSLAIDPVLVCVCFCWEGGVRERGRVVGGARHDKHTRNQRTGKQDKSE